VPYTHTVADIKDRPVAVFGAGTLGRRIALMFASRGGTVRMHDPSALQVRAATEYVAQTLPEVVHKRGSGEVGLVKAAGSVAEALDGAWLAVEAVPRNWRSKFRCGARSTRPPRRTPSSPPTHRHIRHG
jgi:3-hydroxybutyryl-CoA dehydrogenase